MERITMALYAVGGVLLAIGALIGSGFVYGLAKRILYGL